MSWVTNLLLSITTLDCDESEKLKEINVFFERDSIRGFVSLDDASLPRRWYGGSKYWEANLSAGAFNHLDLPALAEHIRSLDWPGPTAVQLIYQDHEETKFTTLDVLEHGWDDAS